MKTKNYLALIAAVALLATTAYFSQKIFLYYSIEQTSVEKAVSSPAATKQFTLIADEKTYTLQVEKETTVLEAMHAAGSSGFVFSGKEYPMLGFFVESINGKTAPQGYYWIFYVNGAQSNTGISTTIIRGGDTIEWRLEESY